MAFKPTIASCLAALATGLFAAPVLAEGTAIGIVAPVDGPYAILGKQVQDGARFMAEARASKGVVINDTCAVGDGAAIATRLIEDKVAVAIGFLCTETLEEALPALKEAGIAAITVGVRSDGLMEDALKGGLPLFRLGLSQSAEVERLSEIISTEWSAEPFALVDDGAIGNHDLVESLRTSLEEKGVKPVLTDTLRPGQEQQLTLVRHLSSSGVLRAFIAADRDDVAVVARDVREAALPISLLAGASVETTPGNVPLPAGIHALVQRDMAGTEANVAMAKALREKGIEPDGYVLSAVAAADIADQADKAAKSEGKPLADILLARAFETALGPIRFTEKHELTENPYEVREWDGHGFLGVNKQ